jgi:uncharacterized protein (DUF488 family)
MVEVVYTVGHSTRSLDELVSLLSEAGVSELVDVRSAPGSRRNPHLAGRFLAASLPQRGITYTHERRLGGFRRPRPDSPNGGWQHEAFRGYADHMASEEFAGGLETLLRIARARPACVMCAEAQWWRCHRRLIADALVVRGLRVLHLGLGPSAAEHELTPFAVVGADLQITYPPAQGELDLGPVAGRASPGPRR